MAEQPTDVASILDQVDILRPLPQQLKVQLEARLAERAVKAGTVIFNEGDPGDSMYLIVSGEVSIFLTDKALGLAVELARLGNGQAFGEMALVTGSPRSATVKALEDTKLLVLSREILFKLVQAAPQVGLMIAAVLAKRTEELNRNQAVEFGTLKGRNFDPMMLELVPVALIKKHRYLPVAHAHGVVTLATPDPANKIGLEDIRQLLHGQKIRVLAVQENDYNTFCNAALSGAAPKAVARPSIANLAKQVNYLTTSLVEEDPKNLAAAANSQDSALLVTQILVEGIDRGASDIQIEPERKGVMIRYRVDGRMVTREGALPKSVHAPVVSRMKVLASLNITERRLPQDGRISMEVGGKGFDLRVATVNTRYGEKVTLRVLDSSTINQQLGSLILAEKVATVVRKLFQQPTGLILVTGPTGSGKTTTLYAALRERMNQGLSICTVEDPVEYDLPGVSQVQVDEVAHLGFAEVLRAFLRQAPDLIFVGETRDAVTARLACNAALTGHMVISSLHTNDTLSAVTRLRGMGVESYLVGGALLGVINQRLVRRICPQCRVETTHEDSVLQAMRNVGLVMDPNIKFYKGKGCQLCGGEGFKGRVGVYELLVVSQKVKDAISEEADMAQLRRASNDGSYVALSRYASFLINQGVTMPSELLRILPRDQSQPQQA
ncbi:MAG: Flp pilus assembly complex ATPase component TadA [Deltaproteobacteria bacterium]|nr:Flp pilus assembly complex ATPase component TadA [Deltaproteobacteria bacterium]